MRAISLLLLFIGCATPSYPTPSDDLTPWTDIADDGTASATVLAAATNVLAADARTTGSVVVSAFHVRDEGRFLRDELIVTLHRPDDDSRCTTLAAVQHADDGWHVLHTQRAFDDVELDAATTCADAIRAVDLVVTLPEAATLQPVWIGSGTAHGRLSRSTCTQTHQLVVELERPMKPRSDRHAAVCIDGDDVQLTSWAPIWLTTD